jgi:hypothetical protein
MDYDEVNNPFITMKKLGGDPEENFVAKLNTPPPNVDNDPYMSNLKQSTHELYSDNRATKMRTDQSDSSLDYSITLMDIDNVLYEYFVNVINPQVVDADNTLVPVPVRHASPEKWKSIKKDGVYRDKKGQLQRPAIIFTRSGMSKDTDFATFNKYLSVPFIKKFDQKNMYDRFSLLNDTDPVYEVHNVTFPDHVVLTYEFSMSTEYVQQMNMLVERINFAEGDYWGDPKRLKFRAAVDSFSNTVEVPSDDDRIVLTTFTLTVNAYLLPPVFDNKSTTQRELTTRKVVWGTEIELENALPTSAYYSLIGDGEERLVLELSRKTRTIYLDDVGKKYEVRMMMDEESYELEILGNTIGISNLTEDGENYLLWNPGNDEVKLKIGESHTTEINAEYAVKITMHDVSREIFMIEFI